MTDTKLKNGLTLEEVKAAKAKFKKVKLVQICKEHGLSYSTINHVLRGTSPKVAELHKAVEIADKYIAFGESLKNVPA